MNNAGEFHGVYRVGDLRRISADRGCAYSAGGPVAPGSICSCDPSPGNPADDPITRSHSRLFGGHTDDCHRPQGEGGTYSPAQRLYGCDRQGGG